MIWLLCAVLSGVMFAVLQLSSAYALEAGLTVQSITAIQLWLGATAMVLLFPVLGGTAELVRLTPEAVLLFMVGGLLQFLAGWTLVNTSQNRLGATYSSLLIAMTPLIGALLAVLAYRRLPGLLATSAMLVMVAGAVLVQAYPHGLANVRIVQLIPGLAAATCFAVAAMIVLEALRISAAPTLGSATGLATAAVAHTALYRPWRSFSPGVTRRSLAWVAFWSATAVSLSTYGRWASLTHIDLGVCLALGLVSLPTVLILAPRILTSAREHTQLAQRLGGVLILLGAATLFLG